MWLQRVLLRLSIRTKKPRFREINWVDDGEVRPVTRGKAKQFGVLEDTAPRIRFRGPAAYRMNSNLSYSSQAPLTMDEVTRSKAASQGRRWKLVSITTE
ncbi:hypothetical protein C8A01DRAFT_37739 [Parachaetomium inaequale]|uniref:Uncharacterized protein n=1 Tax=Parachaetomium inaequale TaxID=2588326 RepID=A0AAN6PD19_9PEZI|nr:hypothetical protein C8A01DRAFT_37739 [Parachaetomium inaequale]